MKKMNVVLTIIVSTLSLALVMFGVFLNEDNNEESDAVIFAREYTEVSEDNVFVYRDIDEIINIMENGTGIVYLGFPECPWCQTYVKYLNEIAKEEGIEKIYYYNILEDRKNNTEEYKKIVKYLEKELQLDEEGNARIFVPNVSFHVDGKLVGNDCETSLDTKGFKDPNEYWNEKEVKDLKEKLSEYMEKVLSKLNTCTDCNK